MTTLLLFYIHHIYLSYHFMFSNNVPGTDLTFTATKDLVYEALGLAQAFMSFRALWTHGPTVVVELKPGKRLPGVRSVCYFS